MSALLTATTITSSSSSSISTTFAFYRDGHWGETFLNIFIDFFPIYGNISRLSLKLPDFRCFRRKTGGENTTQTASFRAKKGSHLLILIKAKNLTHKSVQEDNFELFWPPKKVKIVLLDGFFFTLQVL